MTAHDWWSLALVAAVIVLGFRLVFALDRCLETRRWAKRQRKAGR